MSLQSKINGAVMAQVGGGKMNWIRIEIFQGIILPEALHFSIWHAL